MNKNEFIDFVESRLSVLNKEERDDIISEYVQHINNKLSEGMSEKEAVETLGDPEDLVREILSAYNVDPDYDKENYNERESEVKEAVMGVLHKFTGAIKSVGDFVLGQRFSSLLMFFIKAVLLVFVLMICYVLGREICLLFVGMFGNFLIIRSFVKIAYTIVAVPTVIYIFVRFIDYSINKEKYTNQGSEKREEVNENTTENTNRVYAKAKRVKRERRLFEGDRNEYSFLNIIKSICIFAIKVFVIMCLIPALFGLIFAMIGFGASLVMLIVGYPFAGITIGLLGVNLTGCAIVALIIKLVFFNKREAGK